MENKNTQIYITTYKIVQEKTIPYIIYTIKGEAVLGEIERRFSDFCLLRSKILELYPCIFIPSLPPKKTIGNLDSAYIDIRIKIMNHFLSSLISMKEIAESEMFKVFISNDENFKTKLTNIKKKNNSEVIELYKDLMKRNNIDDNYDYERGFRAITKKYSVLTNAEKNINKMNYYFEKEAQNEKVNHLNMINTFEILRTNEKELNTEMKITDEKISKYTYNHKALNHPFEIIYHSNIQSLSDIEAFKEAFTQLESHIKSYKSIIQQIEKYSINGNVRYSILLGNASPSMQNITDPKMLKLETERTASKDIIYYSTFTLDKQLKDFSKEQVKVYKDNLKKISEMMNENKDKTKQLMDDFTLNM